MTRRVAVIGAGIGGEHVAGYLALPELFQVTHICDLDTERAAPLADATGAKVTASFEDILYSGVDIVDICLPPHLHLEAATQALAAGAHVICEKPLVTSLAEADQLEEAASKSGHEVFPVFQYRFGHGTAQFQALAKAGLIGKPYVASLETHWNRDADYYAIPWRGTWEGERGGAILGHAIHIHDLLTGLLGPIAAVTARLATRVNDIQVEDCGALAIEMASGALVTSSVTLGAANDTSRLRIVTEGLTAESDHAPYAPAAKSWNFTARAPHAQAEINEVLTRVTAPPMGYAGLFSAISDALDGKENAAVRLADGRQSLDFVTAVYASARTGERMTLPVSKDNPLYADWRPSD